MTTPTAWEMAATAGEEPPQRDYRAALTKAYRWLRSLIRRVR